MQAMHEGTGKLVEVKRGDVVRTIIEGKDGILVGRVYQVTKGPRGEEAIVVWFTVGVGGGWLASDLHVVQTVEEREAITGLAVATFLAMPHRRPVLEMARSALDPVERVELKRVAVEFSIRVVELLQSLRATLNQHAADVRVRS